MEGCGACTCPRKMGLNVAEENPEFLLDYENCPTGHDAGAPGTIDECSCQIKHKILLNLNFR